MTLNQLIAALRVHEDKHGDDEIGFAVGTKTIDVLIGEDEDKGVMVTVPRPEW